MFEHVYNILLSGGFVVPPLLLGTLLLWFYLGKRYVLLKKVAGIKVREMLDSSPPKGLLGFAQREFERFSSSSSSSGEFLYCSEEVILSCEHYLSKGKTVIKSIVLVAPLLGLLGTVNGMIETFGSLTDMNLFSSTGGIAGGIGQALISTQMGLLVAIPGILLERMLRKREEELRCDILQLRELYLGKCHANQT